MSKKYGNCHRVGKPGGPGCKVAVLPIFFKDSEGDEKEAELLDAGDKTTELELLRTVAARSGIFWGQDELGWWAVIPKNTVDNNWSVWRQDDNGNKFRVENNLSETEADRLAKKLEATGHRQIYWAEKNTDP
ncbi:MAG: hypothetical protein R2941_19690 [Desulfobacterales bacterium]